MRPTPASLAQRHPLKLGPERRGRIEPLFSAPEENDVSEVDQQEEEDIVQELKSVDMLNSKIVLTVSTKVLR